MQTIQKAHIASNRIVAGDLTTITMLNDDIARHSFAALTAMKLKAAVRRSKDDWIAVLEDHEGIMKMYADGYSTEADALAAAKKALAAF